MDPVVSVPVLSMRTISVRARSSSALPFFTRTPLLERFPAAAMMAVGVARIRAQGQKTTSTVTARYASPVTARVRMATLRAIATMYTAHLSAVRTILDLLALASSSILAMRAAVASAPTRSISTSIDP